MELQSSYSSSFGALPRIIPTIPPTGEYKNPLYLPPSSSIPHQHRSRKAHTSQFTSPPLASFHSIFPLHLKNQPKKSIAPSSTQIPKKKKTECSSQHTSSRPSPSSLPHWQPPSVTWLSAPPPRAVLSHMILHRYPPPPLSLSIVFRMRTIRTKGT